VGQWRRAADRRVASYKDLAAFLQNIAVKSPVADFGEAVAAWTLYFEANPAEAMEAKERRQNGEQLHPEEQCGLSMALTDPE
jgi:hypothetical protein